MSRAELLALKALAEAVGEVAKIAVALHFSAPVTEQANRAAARAADASDALNAIAYEDAK